MYISQIETHATGEEGRVGLGPPSGVLAREFPRNSHDCPCVRPNPAEGGRDAHSDERTKAAIARHWTRIHV